MANGFAMEHAKEILIHMELKAYCAPLAGTWAAADVVMAAGNKFRLLVTV